MRAVAVRHGWGRRIRAQLPFLTVLGIVVLAVLYLAVEPGHWRRAAGVMGVALVLGAALRLTLPAQYLGVLVIRGRYWDTLYYGALGVAILAVDIRLRN